jgi:hypothetical protein
MTVLANTSVPNNTKVTVTAASVGTAPTQIAAADIGDRGVLVNIINNSGGSMTVTVEDPTFTFLSNAPTEPAQAIANTTDGWFRVLPANIDPTTNVATLTLSTVTSVTYKMIRA